MRAFYTLLLLLIVLLPPHILALSPPKHRPPRPNNADAKPAAQNDPSIIVPLYKAALKADAEGRPEDSLKLLSSPPLSLAPGISAKSPPPFTTTHLLPYPSNPAFFASIMEQDF
jgi:hypothetical protein